MTLRNLFNMWSGSIFFYAFLPRCCCIVYYNGAPMALCKYDSRHLGVRCNKPWTACTQCSPTGVQWGSVSIVVVRPILWEFQDTLFAIYPNLLQLVFMHTVQCSYIYYLVIRPVY